MIQIFLVTFLFMFLSWNWGKMISSFLKLTFENKGIYFFLGIIILTIITRIAHFWVSVNAYLFCAFFIISLLYYLLNRKDLDHKILITIIRKNKLLFAFIFLCLIGFAALTSISYDEGLYHAGFIQWSNNYPIVKGLANVQGRFGFNSNWHLLSALFNGVPLWKNPVNALNVGLVLTITIYLFFEVDKNKVTAWAIPLLFIPLILIYHLIDPSADYAIMLFSFVFILSLLNNKEISKDNLVFWVLLLAFLLTVKLNITMLFLLVIYFIYKNRNYLLHIQKSKVLLSFGVILLILVPWIISNIYLSGHLVYPYLPFTFGKESWFVPLSQSLDEIAKINDALVVRWGGISFDEAANLGRIEKWIMYFRSVRIVEKVVIIFSLGSALFVVIKSLIIRNNRVVSILLAFTLLLQIYYVPDLRFFIGTLIGILYLMIVTIIPKKSIFQKPSFISLVVLVEFALSFALYRHLALEFGNTTGNILITKSAYPEEKFERIKVDGKFYFMPVENEYCWNKIPCLLKENEKLRQLGPRIQDGFYQINSYSQKEK